MADTAVETPVETSATPVAASKKRRPAKAPKSPKKAEKKAAKPKGEKKEATHPTTAVMVLDAVTKLADKKGSSLKAIKKYISDNNKVDIDKIAPFIRKAVKSAVVKGLLVQTKGTGVSGSFKLPVKAKPPSAAVMVLDAVTKLANKKGSSLKAIKKYISDNNKVDIDKIAPFIRKAVKSAVVKGVLVQTKGTGASGSFKLPVKAKPASKPKVKKFKPTGSPKVEKTAAKKPTAESPKVKKAAAAKKPTAGSPKKKTVAATKSATPKAKPASPAKSKAANQAEEKQAKKPAAAKLKSPKPTKVKAPKPKVAPKAKASPKKAAAKKK